MYLVLLSKSVLALVDVAVNITVPALKGHTDRYICKMQVIIRAKEKDKEGQWEQKMTAFSVCACMCVSVCALF